MAKSTHVATEDSSGREPGVAVQLLPSPDEPQAKVAIALPKEPLPSNYIPMESHVLVSKLARLFNEKDASRILKLNRRIRLRCALRLEVTFSKADYLYTVFNPDSDPISEEANMPARTPENLEAFNADLETILEMAGFQPVPQEFITVSKGANRLRGFSVQLPPPEAFKVKLYYQRLVPMIPKPTFFQRLRGCCWPWKQTVDPEQGAPEAALPGGEPQLPVHLRIFRSVGVHNAEMLLPGAVARFTLFDKLLIWLPIVIGLCCALYKIHNSTLMFTPKENPVGFATTVALVLMPLSYAAQARVSLQRKADNYKADIDEMLLMRQRSSNAGALQWLLDRAAAQEQKEMLLAYAFLWGGHAQPPPVARETAKSDVDGAIERFLSADILQAEQGAPQMAEIDFDMADALEDVVRAGIVREVGDGDMLQAVPLQEAVDLMSIRNYPEEAGDQRLTAVARKWLQCTKRRRAVVAQRAAQQAPAEQPPADSA